MPILVRCSCGQKLHVPSRRAGRDVVCPVCHQKVAVPSAKNSPSDKTSEDPPTKSSTDPPSPSGERPGVGRTSSSPGTPNPKKSKSPRSAAATANQNAATTKRDVRTPPQKAGPDVKAGPDKRRTTKTEISHDKPTDSTANAEEGPPDAITLKKKTTQEPAPIREPVDKRTGDNEERRKPSPPPLPSSKKDAAPAALPPSLVDRALQESVVAEPAPAPLSEKTESRPEPDRVDASVRETLPEGVEHGLGRRWTVYYLAIGLAALALFGMYPAAMEVAEHVQSIDSPGVASWAHLLLLLGGIQLVYVVYLAQLPDWSTTWVAMFVCAALCALYAAGLGIASTASDGNSILQTLGLLDQQKNGKMTGWCFIMLLLCGAATYFFCRVSLRWHRADAVLAAAPVHRNS